MCKDIVDAGMLKWADIDCSPHLLHKVPTSMEGSALPTTKILMGNPDVKDTCCFVQISVIVYLTTFFIMVYYGNLDFIELHRFWIR